MENSHAGVALVTGASRGIGRAVARRLARDGMAVALTYRVRGEEAAAVVAEIEREGGRAMALQADLSVLTDLSGLFDAVEERLGRLRVVVANAGNVVFKPIAEATHVDFEQAFIANTRGTLLTFSEAARRLGEDGRIIGISTVLTIAPKANAGLYAASKAAVEQLVKALARELGPRRITVNAVAPGPTDTEMVPPARREEAPKLTPLGRLGKPEDIADVIAFLASEESRWITGQIINANGGLA
ncbi:SDR family oxidoreductase [Noviherbaspirillum aerium]|uniref:SDR family oxidoreductase n=1 Tax=Noviherbaspirillum aerium TaxID=2588497 RepID=UPI00124BD5AA|nr:SDR family oxidoreductase [Noviherbaspirillum aerium]